MKNKYTIPLLVVSGALIAGGIYEAVHISHEHSATAPNSVNQAALLQRYPGAIVPELANAKCHMVGVLPDPNCTPGETNPNVTQTNIYATICVSGFTKTIRPPVSYTNRLKEQQMRDYGFIDEISKHEEDHVISLELGGSPDNPRNLWPEPHASPNAKDSVENFLHAAVCAGRITLNEAQHRIATNWTTAEQGL